MKTKNRFYIRSKIGFWFLIFWMLMGCTPNVATVPASNTDPEPASAIETISPQMTESVNSTPMNTNLQTLIDRAKEDLSERVGVDPSKINIIQADAVNWADSSLGCPEPGMMYTQVITPGYLIRLEVDGKIFEYHASKRGTEVVYCKNPQPPAAGGVPLDQ